MRFTLLTFCAAAVVTATLAPAATALAESGPAPGISLTASPRSVGAGGEVELRLTGCAGRTATGRSDAFVAPAGFAPGPDGGLVARTRISSDARPGDHPVRVTCAAGTDGKGSQDTTGTTGSAGPMGTTGTGTVAVIDRGRATPLAPVAAGGGVALFATGDGRQEGPGTAQAVTGLVLAAVTAVAVMLRGTRRRGRRSPD
ncbi:hypothetical protein ABT097_04800 [Streptomyces sp. NPDC002225]|uniref:hypothetical protein n=1 Tax=Streptomyces sp. NPDC002225 TaxID=3154413 RepID=UPI00331D1433